MIGLINDEWSCITKMTIFVRFHVRDGVRATQMKTVNRISSNGVQRPSVIIIMIVANDWVICGFAYQAGLMYSLVQHKSINNRYECCFM